ncbi:tryptophan synthase beta subunit-like PLP-dependent enzyme, partial [Jimgerdemannia flammicorona]
MTTVLDKNVHCVSVEGTFDDCQLFNNRTFNTRHHLGAINSINWARILAQTVYYFHSYFNLLRSLHLSAGTPAAHAIRLHYSVPTGNFGDILAGYYAHRMGLPTARLVVATNSNDILNRFFESASYERQAGDDGNVKETLSPAMDILVSSNFERLLWYLARETEVDGGSEMIGEETSLDERLAGHASKVVDGWMRDLKEKGVFRVKPEVVAKAREIFDSARVSDEEVGTLFILTQFLHHQTLETIRRYHNPPNPSQTSYILDPHTAVGVEAAERISARHHLVGYPTGQDIFVSLATAHPAKFASAVEVALAEQPGFQFEDVLPPEFVGLLERERRVVNVRKAEEALVIEVVERELRKEGVEWDE